MELYKEKKFLIILFLVSISFLFIINIQNEQASLIGNECNTCHGPSHRGHVSYTVSLGASETLLNNTVNKLSVTVSNKDYPLSSSSLTLVPNPDFSLQDPAKTTVNAGNLGRGGLKTVEWSIIPKVQTNKTITITVKFQGTASAHKVFTYNSQHSKTVFVSVVPTPLLLVEATPLTDSTFLVGSPENTGMILIKNIGNLALTNVNVSTSANTKISLVTDQSQTVVDSLIIPTINPHESVNVSFSFDTSIVGTNSVNVTYSGAVIQRSIVTINIQLAPPVPLSLTLGRIIGYITFALLWVSALFGAGQYHLKKYISGRKIRVFHADISNLSFTFVVIHAIVLTIPKSPWSELYGWYELIPERIPASINSLGLELGRWGLLLMYFSLVSGVLIAKIMKRFGRKVGLSIHMLSYGSLIAGAIHALILGGTAKDPILIVMFLVSIFVISWLRVDLWRIRVKKAIERRKKRELIQKKKLEALKASTPEKELPPITVTVEDTQEVSEKIKSGKQLGIVCWACKTINDEDAIFCKHCAIKLEGVVCPNCDSRNDDDANFCKHCATNLQQGSLKS